MIFLGECKNQLKNCFGLFSIFWTTSEQEFLRVSQLPPSATWASLVSDGSQEPLRSREEPLAIAVVHPHARQKSAN